MNVRKFYAHDARIALKKVKETLGADAVILSNRTVEGQVEIMAVAARDMAMVVNTPGNDVPRRAAAPAQRPADDEAYRVNLGAAATRPAAEAPAPQGFPSVTKNPPSRRFGPGDLAGAYAQREEGWGAPAEAPRRAAPAVAPAAAPRPAPVTGGAEMMEELRALRRIVEQHMAGFAWSEFNRGQPGQSELLRQVLDAGFSPTLANEWLAQVDAGLGLEQAIEQLKGGAVERLKALGNGRDLVDEGGIYALVGPTGVGKTTTAAKLAARCVLRHGREKVALVTSDSYRIGAHEQLRAYGRIMGVPVYAVRDPAELQNTLRDLARTHLVLIDTMGMSQRDRNVGEQTAMFASCAVERLLLLNASTRGDTMDDIVAAYGGGGGFGGCVMTKIDEAVSLAPAIDVLLRHTLPLAYVTNGQRVPEDLHAPNPSYLVHRAFKAAKESSVHRYGEREPALIMANAGHFPAQARHA